MDAILPAGSNALIMSGLPKFFLPIDAEEFTLIEYYIQKLEESRRRICVTVNLDFANFIARFDKLLKQLHRRLSTDGFYA
jgi:hypothetical protein